MDFKVKISVAMATYNGEKYLRRQLDSIYKQGLLPFEVIVTDDCSTDNTLIILEEYKVKYGLKYFVNESNVGFVKNFEKAMVLCSGDFIALSDQDDVWLPWKLERLFQSIGDKVLICSDAALINENDTIIADSYFRYQNLYPYLDNLFLNLLFNNFVTGCTILFKRELLALALPIPNIRYHDHWLGLVAIKHGGLIFLDEPLIYYRQHGGNDTGSHAFMSWIEKILNLPFLVKKRILFKERMRIVIDELNKILDSKLSLTAQEKSIIIDSVSYYNNRMRYWINFICVYYGLKHNKIYYGFYGNLFKRFMMALGTIIF